MRNGTIEASTRCQYGCGHTQTVRYSQYCQDAYWQKSKEGNEDAPGQILYDASGSDIESQSHTKDYLILVATVTNK